MENLPFTQQFKTALILMGVALLLSMVGLWFVAWIPGAIAALLIAKDVFEKTDF